MSETSDELAVSNPFEILGLSDDATEHQVRARYLELVKQYPPERDPNKFRQIRAAFEAANDPLRLAQTMLQQMAPSDIPTWQNAIDAQSQRPPTMQAEFILSLGNRVKSKQSDSDVSEENGEPNG